MKRLMGRWLQLKIRMLTSFKHHNVHPPQRYAAHYLRVGNRILLHPCIELCSDCVSALYLFDVERERTVFFSGTIILNHQDYPLNDDIPNDACGRITLQELLEDIGPILSTMEVKLPLL